MEFFDFRKDGKEFAARIGRKELVYRFEVTVDEIKSLQERGAYPKGEIEIIGWRPHRRHVFAPDSPICQICGAEDPSAPQESEGDGRDDVEIIRTVWVRDDNGEYYTEEVKEFVHPSQVEKEHKLTGRTRPHKHNWHWHPFGSWCACGAFRRREEKE